jgi:hypothetical protein
VTNDTRILVCGHPPSPHSEHTTGTAHYGDREICWECAAMIDLGHLIRDGHSKSLPFYLTLKDTFETTNTFQSWHVSNWPGTLSYRVFSMRKGKHNIGRTRVDVWFVGPDKYVWHGVNIGDTQVCHCKRTSERWTKG